MNIGASSAPVLEPQAHGGALNRYPKGQTGNPGGRKPKPIAKLLKALENNAEAEAIARDYLALCHSEDERIRLEALKDLFDRSGWSRVSGDTNVNIDARSQTLILDYAGVRGVDVG